VSASTDVKSTTGATSIVVAWTIGCAGDGRSNSDAAESSGADESESIALVVAVVVVGVGTMEEGTVAAAGGPLHAAAGIEVKQPVEARYAAGVEVEVEIGSTSANDVVAWATDGAKAGATTGCEAAAAGD
jgi:hypothetical protein